MAKLNTNAIRDLARQIVAAHSGGIRYTALIREILDKHPETLRNTIVGSVWNLNSVFPEEITKPIRGLFKPAGVHLETAEAEERKFVSRAREQDFYEPFADWLKNDLDEVTVSAPLGGAGLRNKWGTPDVVGVYKPSASDLIKFNLEIVSAEIKTNPGEPVVAFGQAVAYRLFSSKMYVVMPGSLPEEDLSRLEAMCILFGVGLVLFDLDVNDPSFRIRVRGQRFSPDMFYVNEFAHRLLQHDRAVFERLFA